MSARILVVDDLPANLKLLEARLNAEYFAVQTASNGRDALEICERGQCGIVLLGVVMPGVGGVGGAGRAPPEEDPRPPPHPDHHGDRARPAFRPREGAGSRRR